MSTVTAIWRKQPGEYFCISTKSPKSNDWKDTFFHRSELDEVDEFIAANSDKNLYWCPHGFSKKRRLKEYAVKPKLLWADLDAADPRKMNGTKPTVAWESSPNRFAALWHIDREMDEELNRQLTMTVGADPGGWDLTQVLRVPGSINYKYGKGVPGKKLWFKPSEVIPVRELKKHLKEAPAKSGGKIDTSASKEIYKRYEKKMSSRLRQIILQQRVVGDRSKVLWEMGNMLIQLGLTKDEWLTLVASTVWNKFADRPHQLDREYEKILADRLKGDKVTSKTRPKDDSGEAPAFDFEAGVSVLADIEWKNVDWLITGWIPRNMISIIEGDPGIGKSFFTQFLCTHIIKGTRLPLHWQYGKKPAGSTCVLYIDLENDAGMVTKPRMMDLGLTQEEQQRFFVFDRAFSLSDPDAVEALRQFILSRKGTPYEIGLVVFDTINTYMGDADTHKASDVQQSLSNVALIARETEISVILLRHLSKGSRDGAAIYKGQGSIGFAALARQVIRIAEHPVEDEVLVAKIIKTNISKREPALKFKLEEMDRLPGRDSTPTRIEVLGHDLDLRDDQLGTKEKKKEGGGDTVTDAKIWLAEKLDTNGAMFLHALHDEMKKRNKTFTEKTLDKAAKELDVKRKKVGNSWKWFLR